MRALGIDGGGTGTKYVLLDRGRVRRLPDGPPANGLLDADLAERIVRVVWEVRPDAVGIGLAGLRDPAAARRLTDQVRAATDLNPLVADDAAVALWGAFGAGAGAVLIAGTGSVALGRAEPGGPAHRLGGHGYLVGDEGSGYWIGRELARYALRSLTGVDPRDLALESAVITTLGLSPGPTGDDGGVRPSGSDEGERTALVHAIESAVYATPGDRAVLAGITRTAAGIFSPRAGQVFAEAVTDLIALAEAARRALGEVPIALVGGLWRVRKVREAFIRAVPAERPARSPAEGAALWAVHHAVSGPQGSG
ncbi:N-acetylglucosamine kinase [Nonomuraea lactucae]|uniref:N-acetylglucosamine kinase n=1 Tax=Nonomuraea lactucae TaxID=2249762 RepID=UPI000DE21D74|nr:BadF/BadG/BcrA/BcrD ATPase family protein [Nonomuraea lactucae]